MDTARPQTPPQAPDGDLNDLVTRLADAGVGTAESFNVKAGDGTSEKLVDAIEMIGEEQAAGYTPQTVSAITPGMRYLHSSRTIHQLVTDRNRAVGIYLAVASLLLTASSTLLHADPKGDLILPHATIQRWCLPLTFGVLAGLAFFAAFLLIRTRIGLIYEVAKMNALLGLPIGRVQRINPLSIHFIMHALISTAGGLSAGLCGAFLLQHFQPDRAENAWYAVVIGGVALLALIALYIVTVWQTTSDRRLQQQDSKWHQPR